MFYVVELSLTRNEQSSLISQPLCLFCFTSSCRASKKRDQGKKIPLDVWVLDNTAVKIFVVLTLAGPLFPPPLLWSPFM